MNKLLNLYKAGVSRVMLFRTPFGYLVKVYDDFIQSSRKQCIESADFETEEELNQYLNFIIR